MIKKEREDKRLLDEGLLWQSAEHWLKNWTYPENASTAWTKCACCLEYYQKEHRCSGCPIREHTGKSCCEGTPYRDASDALHSYHASGSRVEFRRHAEAMYTLLVELALLLGQEGTIAGTNTLGREK